MFCWLTTRLAGWLAIQHEHDIGHGASTGHSCPGNLLLRRDRQAQGGYWSVLAVYVGYLLSCPALGNAYRHGIILSWSQDGEALSGGAWVGGWFSLLGA